MGKPLLKKQLNRISFKVFFKTENLKNLINPMGFFYRVYFTATIKFLPAAEIPEE